MLSRIRESLSDIPQKSPYEFSKHSAIGIGGAAKLAFFPTTIDAMRTTVTTLQGFSAAYCIVGNMTNVLPPDDPKDLIVVGTQALVGARIGRSSFVLAGTGSGALLRACRYAEKSGVEFLSGIPCTLGGALYMNAGAQGRYMSDITESVVVLRAGRLLTISAEECAYDYKHSVFMENADVILGAYLRLTDDKKSCIEEREREYLRRRAGLPHGKSMGCVFKNPKGGFAGEWIEKAGLKGLRRGGAFVSERHANFIINDGGATEDDVCRLIEEIKERVYVKFGVRLEEEIRFLT